MVVIPSCPVKRGFEIVNKFRPVILLDRDGKPFYSTVELLKQNRFIKAFNVPPDIELKMATGDIVQIKPIKYRLKSLPFRQRFEMPNPRKFNVEFGVNPNKCSVLWDLREIFWDENFFDSLTIPERFFILFHEYGHQYYVTEKYCDLYAYNEMLKYGFNETQAGMSQIKTLGDYNNDRKDFVISKI
jgi:hypothetical protein